VRLAASDLERACSRWVRAGATKHTRHWRRAAARDVRAELPYVAERVDRGTYYFEMPNVYRTSDGRTVAVSPPIQSIVLSALAREIVETKYMDRKVQAACGGLPPGRGPSHAVWWTRLLLRMASASTSPEVSTLAVADVQSAFPSLSPEFAVQHARGLGVRGDVLDACAAFCQLTRRNPSFPGLPTGAPISAPLAEIALEPLDAALATSAYEVVRYVDNLAVIFAGERSEAEVRSLLDRALDSYERRSCTRLALHDVEIVTYDRGLGFTREFKWLGYRFRGRGLDAAPRTLTRFAAKVGSGEVQNVDARIRGILGYYRPLLDTETMVSLERELRSRAST
jgi:hypothetical protein